MTPRFTKRLRTLTTTVSVTAMSFMTAATVRATTVDDSVFKPLGDLSIPEIAGRAISAVLGLVGVIALLMFVYAGLVWMTAGGNEEKITKAKQTMAWAALGLIVILSSMAITNFVVGSIVSSTSTVPSSIETQERQAPAEPIDRGAPAPTGVTQ